jgi:hypothetical protein
VDLLLKVSFILLIDRNILIVELDIPLAHPVLTRSAYPTELLTPCLDLLQFREVPSALVFFTSSTQSALHLISKDVGPSFLLWTLLVEIVPHLKVLHEHLLSLVTPIHITDALLTIVKVPHVPGPVLAQHLLPTLALEANGESFLNLLSPLLSLRSVLLSWVLLMIIARVTSSISHVLTIFNIINILKTINYIQPIKLPNYLLNYQSTS